MNYKKWLELFPGSTLVQAHELHPNNISFPLEDGTFLQIAKEQLSERELFLLEQLVPTPVQSHTPTPWQRYLENNGKIPATVDTLQVIHIAFSQQPSEFHETEWLKMMRELLPNSISIFRCFAKHYSIVLTNSKTHLLNEELQQLHSTLEEDFGMSMHFFVGNSWGIRKELPDLYQAEKALFVAYLHESNRQAYLEFTATLLWGLTNPRIDLAPIPSILQELMEQEEATPLIEALWEERGTLTKAASRLFIHRNTLQYRIDRFAEHSGLHLKNINDLTLAHLLLNLQEY